MATTPESQQENNAPAAKKQKHRCQWARNGLSIPYHDEEWGVPVHDDRLLFEFLILEGAQAGLSWDTVLKKRDHYRKVFANFDPQKVSRFRQDKIDKLLMDPGIIRNRLKVESAVSNAKAFLKIQKEFGSFDAWLWAFVDGKPIRNRRQDLEEIPATTPLSDTLSRELKKRGFRFVGSTIIYAFMQAVGMVNDHEVACFRYRQIK